MSITIWNRLEARPRTLNTERALRAEIRDPLWMLTRQWQFGEFLGTDSGTAVLARVRYQQSRLKQVKLGNLEAEAYSGQYPLEAVVEKQSVRPGLQMRMEMGRQWLRLLKRHLPAAQAADVIRAFREDERWHFHLPEEGTTEDKIDQAPLRANPAYMRLLGAIAQGRMLDGGALHHYLKANPGHRASDFLPSPVPAVDEVGGRFTEWFEKVYGQEGTGKDAWQPSRLEYRLQAEISGPQSRKLSADDFSGGRLDWYQFDYSGSQEVEDKNAEEDNSWQTQVFIPTPASYPGMPVARYWEMEDHRINFGNIQAASTDSAKLIFAQFGLLYGNDWLCIPLELPLGQMHRISELEVTDVFGQRLRIPHVHHRGKDEYWGFFQVHDRAADTGQQNDGALWLPPVVSRPLSGDPVEKVVFIRDEMANMVWGIENTISDQVSTGMDGFEQAQRVQAYIHSLLPVAEPEGGVKNDALEQYRLASEVPDNWIPFIPVRKEDSVRDIQLQRAAMPRVIPGHITRRIRPQSTILEAGGFQSPYLVFEEEIPRAGAIVYQQWNRCRWHDGSIVLWLSRTKTNGRGEQSSGLRHDFLEGKEK